MAKKLKKVASFAAPIIGGALGGPVGAAIGGAASGAISGQGLKGVALGGATGYAGNVLGSSIGSTLTKSLGSVGGASIGSVTSKNAFGPFTLGNLGSTAGNAIGNTVANTTLGSALGQFAGNSIADNLASSFMPTEMAEVGQPVAQPSQDPQPFEPEQEAQLQLPNSLSGLASFSPNQISSNLATQGVYGGGLGPEEQDYFTNMINRRLVDETGQVDQDLSEINPIENSYLAQLGFSGYSNPQSLLESLYGRKKQAAYA